jgi:Tfp pilus assembly protein PilF
VRGPGGPVILRPVVLGGIAVVWVVLAFLPVVRNDFVNWDDHRMFLDNPAHLGSWGVRLRGAWGSHLLGEYMPVTWMSYGLDLSLWGPDASGYHFSSVLLHAVTALLVLALTRHLVAHALGPRPRGFPGSPASGDGDGDSTLWLGGAVAALVFALHPLRVEAVAWASARGTILGGLFVVASVLAYVVGWNRGWRTGRVSRTWLVGSLLLFAAALLSRATSLVLPAVLVTLDVYPLRRLGGGPGRWLGRAAWPVWAEKAPYGALALLAIPVGFLARGEEVGDFWRFGYDPLIALVWSVYSPAFYVRKTLVPLDLSPLYPMPEREAPMLGAVLLSLAAVASITAALVALRRRWPGVLTAWVVYGIVLAPLSGILPFGRLRGVGDRYTYLACVGWAMVAGGAAVLGWRALQRRRSRVWTGFAVTASLAVLLGWSVLSWQQCKIWRDGLTLWRWALRVVPESPVVHNNLAWVLAHAGEWKLAETYARRARDAWPTQPAVLRNLGRIVAAQGRFEESAEIFRRLVQVAPSSPDGHTDLGSVLHELGASGRALAPLERAIQLDPDLARAHEYLGRALSAEGRRAEAEVHLRRAAELRGETRSPDDGAAPPGAAGPGPGTRPAPGP